MPLEPLTPERRREMTRSHLLEAAAEVFQEHGFHGATLDEVARRAGFTKGAVYSNFKNKDDLFLAVMDDRIERQFAVAAEVLESGSHDEAEQRSRVEELLHSRTFFWDEARSALYLEFILYARRNPDAAEKLRASIRRARQMTVDLIDAETAAGGAPARRPHEQVALLSQAIFDGIGLLRLIDPSAVTDETMDTVLGFLYDSM
ncbi:MAG TPA: TetR/AcrR family transcriptional regulator [Acidimicrobiia bacterium]|jgi:AcrR family transcriptional regulator|nr:TetR/AcrR family transcriptional regulator [Acidimicrobiia bacterium]